MSRKKKEEVVQSKKNDFSNHINELQSKLKLANICNNLITSDNPFSIEIDDSKLLESLKLELKQILYNKINDASDVNIEASDAVTNEAAVFTDQEIYVLKEIASRTLNKNSANYNQSIKPAKDNVSINKNINNNDNKKDYYEEGDILVLTSSTIMIKDDDREVIRAGQEVTLIESFKNGTMLVMNNETGEEGIIEISKVKKIYDK